MPTHRHNNEPPSPPFFLMPLRNIPAKIKGADTAYLGNINSFQSPLRKSHPWKEMWILWNGHHSLDSWYKVPCGFFLVLETVGLMWEGETLYSRQNNTKEMATNDSDRSMPLYKGGPGLKNFFWPFGPQFDPKIRGGGVAPLDPPLSDMEMGWDCDNDMENHKYNSKPF